MTREIRSTLLSTKQMMMSQMTTQTINIHQGNSKNPAQAALITVPKNILRDKLLENGPKSKVLWSLTVEA